MPKSVDGDIRISVSLDSSSLKSDVGNTERTVAKVKTAIVDFGKSIASAFDIGSEKAENYNTKLARAEEAVKKQESALEQLKRKYEALKNGDVKPKSLKAIETEIEKIGKKYDEASENMKSAKEKADAADIGFADNPAFVQAKSEYESMSDTFDDLDAQMAKLYQKQDELLINPQNSAEGMKLEKEIELATMKLNRLKTEAELAADAAEDGAKSAAKATAKSNEETKKTPVALKSAQKGFTRLKAIVAGAFLFNVIRSGLTQLRKTLTSLLKSNNNFSSSLSQIKGNLKTAFAPVYEALLPAINSVMSALKNATAYFAAFISSLFNKTVEESADAAQKLETQAKKSEKNLAGFDQINKLSSSKEETDFSGTSLDEKTAKKVYEFSDRLKPVMEGFSNFAENLASVFNETVLPLIGNALNGLIDFLDSIGALKPAAVETILTALSGFFVTLSGIKISSTLAPVMEKLGNALKKILEKFSATELAALVGVAAIFSFFSYFDKSALSGELYESICQVKEELEDVNSVTDSINEYTDSIKQKSENIETDAIYIIKLATKFFDLSQKENRTPEENVLLKQYSDTLCELVPGIKDNINAITGAWEGTREQMRGLIKDQIKLAYAQMYQDELAQLIRQSIEAEENIEKAQQAYDAALADYKQANEDYQNAVNNSWVDRAFNNLGITDSSYNGGKSFFEAMLAVGRKEEIRFREAEQNFLNANNALKDAKQAFDDISVLEQTALSIIVGDDAGLDAHIEELFKSIGFFAEETEEDIEGVGKQVEATENEVTELSDKLGELNGIAVSPDFSNINNNLSAAISDAKTLRRVLKNMPSVSVPGALTGFRDITLNPPALAQGAVIPANKPFLSILGDQTSGTNIEAPLSTIESAVENVMRKMTVGNSHSEAVLEIDGEQFGRIIYRLNKNEGRRIGVKFSEITT